MRRSGAPARSPDPIAIVGAACRFPGSEGLDGFWNVLDQGLDAVTEVPEGRWSKDFFFHPDPAQPGKSYTWSAGVLGDVAGFDAGFFGIAPREAEQIDPQQRLLLELAWEALEDAGVPASRIKGQPCGVYVGLSGAEYANVNLGDPAGGDAHFMTGTTASIAANRLSYVLDLHGPSLVVDTACSSSLVALHLACEALRGGEIGAALVGGVNLLLSPYPFIGFCRASMLSPSGRCFAFDARANGYVRSEGGAVVLLKPLADALADGDRIRAVVLGDGVNSDGRTVGISLPNAQAQASLLRSVYERSGVGPEELDFIEAHGTGTQAGDPIETAALGEALGRARSTPLPIGSVKTNIGHLETASGLAGLLKTVLAFEHRRLPRSLHFETPNPRLRLEEGNLEVVSEPRTLPAGRRLVAGVNSFGFGGTNAHAILASAPVRAVVAANEDVLPPLLISARSQAALRELAERWSTALEEARDDAAAGALIRAAARRRDHHRYRLMARGGARGELARALRAEAASERAPDAAVGDGKVVFVFSGNGAQWAGMGLDAHRTNAVFREAVAEADARLQPLTGWSAARMLEEADAEALASTELAQPLLFTVQVGIVRALQAEGIEPDACVGHSVGEIAAAWAAGKLSLEDAARIVVVRSREQERTRGAGRMAALGLGQAQAAGVLERLGLGLEIAAVNSAAAVTVVGDPADIARLGQEAEAEGWRFTALDLDYAFHSRLLDGVCDGVLEGLRGLRPREGEGGFVSSVTGGPLGGSELDAEYWWRNVRDPVRFDAAIDALIGSGFRLFAEIGPAPILQSYVREQLKAAGVDGRVTPTLTRQGAPADPFPELAAALYAGGYDLSRSAAFEGAIRLDGLPRHPWRRERFWVAPTGETTRMVSPEAGPSLLGFARDPEVGVWTRLLDIRQEPWLAEHAVDGAPVLPAAAIAEMALAAARARFGPDKPVEVVDLDIARGMALEPGRTREVRVRITPELRISIESRPRLTDEPWTFHASGAARVSAARPPARETFEAARIIPGERIYRTAAAIGLDYGASFRTVHSVEVSEDGGSARVRLTAEASPPGMADCALAPSLLDGALQGLIGMLEAEAGASGAALLPSRIGRLRVFEPAGRLPVEARLRLTRRGRRSASADIDLFDAGGEAVAALKDCWLTVAHLRRPVSAKERSYRFGLAPAPRGGAAPPQLLEAARAAFAGAVAEDPRGTEAGILLDAYLAAGAYAAACAVAPVGTSFQLRDLERRRALARGSTPLFARTLHFLAGCGLAEETDEGWRLEPDSHLGPSEAIWRTLLAERPDLGYDLALAAQAIAELPGVFRLGPSSPTPLAERLEHLQGGSSGVRRVVRSLAEQVAALAAVPPPGRTMRMLEVGAGDGALARALSEQPGGWPARLAYVGAEAGSDRTGRLSVALDAFPQCEALDWRPGQDGAGPRGRFDLIVAARGLTGLADAEAALADLRDRLADGGVLLLAEPEPGFLLDLLLGGDPDWWGQSLSPELPVSRLRAEAELRRAADAAGLLELGCTPIAAVTWPARLFALARASARETAPARPAGRKLWIAPAADPALRAALAAAAGGEAALETLQGGDPGEADDILVLPAADGQGDPVALASAPMMAVVDLAKRLAGSDRGRRLWVVSRGAQAGGTDAASAAAGAAVAGLVRSLSNELPGIEGRVLDLDPQLGPDAAAAAILAEVRDPDEERELVLGADGRWALRLLDGLPEPDLPEGDLELAAARPGLLDTLEWRPSSGRAPGPGEIAIEVRAAGLNFRDVMWAQGLLPEEALLDGFAGPTFGLECAGIVEAVGEGVSHLSPGDRVIAFAPQSLSTRVVTAAHAAAALPDGLGFEAGATIPVAYLTAVYALGRLARLSAGERVLIHGAAGGVGLAAVQYAKHLGATVFATAGSPLKRAFLRSFGADVVLDSRSLAFADEIERLTGGEGVDVVLNSLSGEAMERSLGLLRPFGRFLELGKRDFYFGGRVGLRPFRQNISYFGIDADQLPAQRPQLCASVIAEIMGLLQAGAITPLPHRSFRRDAAVEAFRLMQGSGHIGKLVLLPERPQRSALRPAVPAFEVRADGTYLVSGGLTGFGLETARWLAERGARHLALIGRRGLETPGAAEAVEALEDAGAQVRVFACDVADPQALDAVLRQLRAEAPPLRGVVHAAMVVDDALVADLTAPHLERVLAPKLAGALNLDRLTAVDGLDWFLLYSSATTFLGAPGQGGYVAANAALEAVARSRRARGLPAMAIAWGPIADAGYLAREAESREALARRLAAIPMPAREALEAIPDLWASGEPAAAYAIVQWASARRALPILATPAFARFAGELAEGMDEDDIRERLEGLGLSEATELVVEVLAQEISRILGVSERIDPGRPLSEYGMDSLMAVELRLAVETRLGVNLPLLSLADGVSVSAIAGRIARSLKGEAAAPAPLVEAAVRHEMDAPALDRAAEAAEEPARRVSAAE